MSSRSNVLPLRPYQQAPSWWTKLVVVATYWLVAYVLPRFQSGEVINVLMLLAIAYWALVYNRKQWVPYYIRYHWLQVLLIIAFLGIGAAILGALINTCISILPIVGLDKMANQALYYTRASVAMISGVIMFGVPFVMGLGALFGKNPTLPSVSDQARQWA